MPSEVAVHVPIAGPPTWAMTRHTLGMAVNWGDVPTWVAGIGTVGTLAAALWQIRNERQRRLTSDKQLRVERHLEQARLVAAYMGEEEKPEEEARSPAADEGRTAFYLANNSPEPVYSVVVGMVFAQGAGPRTLEEMIDLNQKQYSRPGPVTTVSILPGGLYRVWIAGTGWHRILGGRAGVDLAFTDRTGAHWIRRATGQLDELAKPPLEYLQAWDFYGPHDFQTPERVPRS
jgi:hypothetical protein